MTGEKTRTKNKTNFLIVCEQNYSTLLYLEKKTITTKWYSQSNKIVFQVTFEFSIKEIEQKNLRPLCKQASRKPTEGQFKSFFEVFVSRKLKTERRLDEPNARERNFGAQDKKTPRANIEKKFCSLFVLPTYVLLWNGKIFKYDNCKIVFY